MINSARKLNKCGFTLIEMLVVVSVIGILVSLAGHHHTRVLQKARDASLKLEISQIRVAIHQYALENSGRFPENIEALSPGQLKSISSNWQGAQGKGAYHYNSIDGTIALYDAGKKELSPDLDSGGNKYGDY